MKGEKAPPRYRRPPDSVMRKRAREFIRASRRLGFAAQLIGSCILQRFPGKQFAYLAIVRSLYRLDVYALILPLLGIRGTTYVASRLGLRSPLAAPREEWRGGFCRQTNCLSHRRRKDPFQDAPSHFFFSRHEKRKREEIGKPHFFRF